LALYPAVILIIVAVVTGAGFLFFVGRGRNAFNGGSLAATLPLLFTAVYSADYIVSIALWPAALLATAMVVGFFIPLTVVAEKSSTRKPAGFSVARGTSLIIMFAAVFKLLTFNGLNPLTMASFAAAGFLYTFSFERLGKISALALANITAAAGLYVSFTVPQNVFTSDITLIVAIITLYTLGMLSHKHLERFRECLTPVNLALLTVFAAAVLFSPLSRVETVDSELKLEQAFFLMPAVFLSFSPPYTKDASRFFEAMLFVLAVSITVVGGGFPNATAELLAPLVGTPVKGLAAQTVQAVLQLTGLSTMAMILAHLSESVQATTGTRMRAALMYGAPAAAIILAVCSALGTSLDQMMLLAGSANMLIFSLAMVLLGGRWLMPAIFLFMFSSNTVIIQSAVRLPLVFELFNPLSLASFTPLAMSMFAVGLTVWVFSEAVAAWLRRRALLTGL